VSRHITDIGYPDIDTLAVFMAAIQCEPPPTRVGPPFTTSIVWRRKSGEGCRIQCQHQNLWPGPPVQLHSILCVCGDVLACACP
jgi:hypothetical protein